MCSCLPSTEERALRDRLPLSTEELLESSIHLPTEPVSHSDGLALCPLTDARDGQARDGLRFENLHQGQEPADATTEFLNRSVVPLPWAWRALSTNSVLVRTP